MPDTATVVMCNLPTPDMVVVNHPKHGTLIFADRRIPGSQVAALRNLVNRRAALHPADWSPHPHRWLSAAGA